jgi:hypothetical protein
MPWFRFIGEAQVTLRFRNAPCQLSFANLGEADGWAWVAEKVNSPSPQVVLVRKGNVMALHAALMVQGFEVEAGTAAEKVMRAATKCGFAEELPEEERWRKELISARARLR